MNRDKIMTEHENNLILAMAGMCQACALVRDIANTGQYDRQAYDTSIRTIFKINADIFIKAPKSLFESQPTQMTANYNAVVNACISCHEVTCVGPISRIKKLYLD